MAFIMGFIQYGFISWDTCTNLLCRLGLNISGWTKQVFGVDRKVN
jgi:hypothetical protein